VPLLREAGHGAIAVDLPGDDETAGLPEYTSLVTGAIGGPPSGCWPPGRPGVPCPAGIGLGRPDGTVRGTRESVRD
jgi:hypothetical protein